MSPTYFIVSNGSQGNASSVQPSGSESKRYSGPLYPRKGGGGGWENIGDLASGAVDKAQVLKSAAKYFKSGKEIPAGLSSKRPRSKPGPGGDEESCSDDDDDPACKYVVVKLQAREEDGTIHDIDAGHQARNATTAIVSVKDAEDMCAFMGSSTADSVRGPFIAMRSSCAKGRKACSEAVDALTPGMQTLLDEELSGGWQKDVVQGALGYLEPVEDSDARKGAGVWYLDVKWRDGCTQYGHGIIPLDELSSEARDVATTYGLDIWTGANKFEESAAPTDLINGRNATDYRNHLFDLSERYRNDDTDEKAKTQLFKEFQGFIDFVGANTAFQEDDQITKARDAMQSTIGSDRASMGYTQETIHILESPSSKFTPGSLALTLLTAAGTAAATSSLSA